MKKICALFLLATAVSLSQLGCSSGNQTTTNANAPNNTSGTFSSTNNPGTANTGPTVPPATANANNADSGGLTELVMFYGQYFGIRMKGDKAKAEGMLADDYKETTGDGKTLTKAQVLAAMSQPKKFETYTLDDLKTNTAGDTGTVTGHVTVIYPENKKESWQFTDTFKKQGGDWRATSSKITDFKKQ